MNGWLDALGFRFSEDVKRSTIAPVGGQGSFQFTLEGCPKACRGGPQPGGGLSLRAAARSWLRLIEQHRSDTRDVGESP